MPSKIVLSIIIPCYNADKWIEKAILSVLNQSDKKVELIVVNDGSTDNSSFIINKYKNDILIINQNNLGVSISRNKGISVSNGKFIKFLDADDEIPMGGIDIILTATDRFPHDVLVGRSISINVDGNIFDTKAYNIPAIFSDGEEIKKEFLFTQAVSSALWIIPKDIVNSFDGFDCSIRLGEEFSFTRRLVNTGVKCIFLDHVISYVRNHDGPRLSRIASESDYLQQLASIEECVGYFVSAGLDIDQRAIHLIGKMCWSLGRECYRSNYKNAGDSYINYARLIGGKNVVNGRLIYKLLIRVFNPKKLEYIMTRIKRFIVISI